MLAAIEAEEKIAAAGLPSGFKLTAMMFVAVREYLKESECEKSFVQWTDEDIIALFKHGTVL